MCQTALRNSVLNATHQRRSVLEAHRTYMFSFYYGYVVRKNGII